MVCFGMRREKDLLGNRWGTYGHSDHHVNNDQKSRGHGEVWFAILCVPVYKH